MNLYVIYSGPATKETILYINLKGEFVDNKKIKLRSKNGGQRLSVRKGDNLN